MVEACVVDNSVVVSWVYPAQSTKYTERLLETTAEGTLHTAFIWPAEFANAASVMVRRAILTDELGVEMIRMADALSLTVDRTPADLGSLYRLSRCHGLSVYAAAYLELAMRLRLPMATRDAALEKAAKSLDLYLT